ncbi:zinc finger protein 423 homolog isoform X2 [Toxorhynchites rutilus septentrionalis]|uniref:zinc finger protein 423 homolog isoform X2 n=1 Tax=Toxorhynchites rutilus septentrionalis TaxID=329112 RepID=UPI002479F327|nr:zinc finger protein 423 homolog isoform X2 [Toxorhynchites rutilus septentrionalis]
MAMRMLYRGPSSRLETLIEKIQQTSKDYYPLMMSQELYSSHTSSSFSPSISDGMTTPNSITNDADARLLLANGDSSAVVVGTGAGPTAGAKCRSERRYRTDNNNKIIKNNNHTNSHSKNNDGTYRCQFCDKTFPRLGYLKKHEQSHTEHMPFKCEYCARLFKHKRSRDRHTKLHTGDRRYRCPHCEAAFSRSDHLKIHMKTHDNQKPFQCTICNRGYNTAAALTSHMQNHKKQIALTGSPNLTYSPRSTSSLSSSASNPKRKFSPYEQNLMMINRSKLLKSGELTCIYCTRTDFANVEQLGAHVQTMHSNLLLNENNFHRHASPDTLLSYPPIACEFCTMKFPTIPMMFNHLKSTHLDRINSPNSYLEQFNKNLMNTYTSFYGAPFFEDKQESRERTEVKSERPASEKSVRDENGNEEASIGTETKVIKQEKDENDNSQEAQEQLAPTDLSQPRMKKMKVESETQPNSGSNPREVGKDNSPGASGSIQPTPPGAYLCNQCNAALPDFESFRNHLKAHLEQGSTTTSYVCQQCGVTLADQQEYEKHVTNHYLVTGAEYLCDPTCNKNFPKAEELHKHLYEVHTQVLYKCALCNETFDSKVNIQVHFAVTHSSEVKLYRCTTCAEVFRTEREFRHHIRSRHISSGAVQCVFCRVVCSSELEMQFHLAAHARKFKCPACPESFHVEFLLDRHMQTHHSQKEISNAAAAAASNVVGSNSSASSLEYLQLHGQMAAAAAGWQNLYAANKFYNPLHVDTINSMKHPNFLHGFYESLNKSHAQRYLDQPKKEFVNPTNTAQSKTLMNLYNQRPSAMNGLYSPDRLGTNASSAGQSATNNIPSSTSNSSSKSQQMYSPTTLLHRYGINPSATSTPNNVVGQPTAVEKSSLACAKNNTSNYYSCGICERNDFSTENEVQTHRKIVHNLKTGVSLRCAYCSGDFRSRNELENHMKIAHNTGGKHKCLICDEIFPSPAVLAEHKLTHCKVGASGRCSHCPTTLPDVHSFKSHLTQHQQSSSASGSTTSNNSTAAGSRNSATSGQEQERFPIQCICCRQTLNSEFEISLHAKFHTKSSEINEKTCALCLEPLAAEQEAKICETCLKRHNFPSKLLSINNFMKSSASAAFQLQETPTHQPHSSAPRSPQNPSNSAIQCNLCKKYLVSNQKLQEHLIDHTFAGCEDRGFVCYLCSSVFTSSTGLQTHIIEHGSQAKPYECNHCDEAFFFRAELEHHLVDHELGKVHLASVPTTEASSVEIKSEVAEAASKEEVGPAEQNSSPSKEHEEQKEETATTSSTSSSSGESGPDQENGDEDDEYIEVEHNIEESGKEPNANMRQTGSKSHDECID